MNGDTGGVNLSEGKVGQICAFLECLDGSRAVAAHGVCRQEESTAIAAGGEHYSVGGVAFDFTCHEVADNDTAGAAVDNHNVEHFATVERTDSAFLDLTVERAVGAEKELLAGLAFGIECTAYLSTAERAVCKQTAVFACEWNTLLNALVDDVIRHFGQTVNVGFARTEVAAFHGVVEQAVNGVAVVLVVLGCIDAALCCDGVCAAGAVLDAEVIYVETHFAQRRCCRSTGKAGADDDNVEVALVGGVYKVLMGLVVGPFLSDRTFGNL